MLKFDDGVKRDNLDKKFLARLDFASWNSGDIFVITSGFRRGKGCHGSGKAVDIRCKDSRTRFDIVYSLLNGGFKRIGFGNKTNPHVHVDSCIKGYDQKVFWME